MGWVASAFLISAILLMGEKSIWGFVCGALGNALWVYVGLKRGKQYDLAVVAVVATLLNIWGLYKWLG